MSNTPSRFSTNLINHIKATLQEAEELGATSSVEDYLFLMESVAKYAIECHNNAVINMEGDAGQLSLTKIGA
jgi:hypothetical protein